MPKSPSSHPRPRLSVHIDDATSVSIKKMLEYDEARTITEIIRRAVAAYDAILEQKARGGTVVFKDADGKENRVIFS